MACCRDSFTFLKDQEISFDVPLVDTLPVPLRDMAIPIAAEGPVTHHSDAGIPLYSSRRPQN
jgi:hypothetical protein